MRKFINIVDGREEGLNEVFDGKSGWEWQEKHNDFYYAKFVIPADGTDVTFSAVFREESAGFWTFNFGNDIGGGKFNLNLTGMNNPIPVFSTLASIVDAFVSEAKPRALSFEPPYRQKYREAVYRRLAQKIAQKYGAELNTFAEDDYDATSYTIKFQR